MAWISRRAIEVVYTPSEGALSAVLPSLRRRLTVLGRDADLIRVGVTSDVDRRAGHHRTYGFDWFVVLWETSSADRVAEAEPVLLEHARWKGLPLSGERRGGSVGAGPSRCMRRGGEGWLPTQVLCMSVRLSH